uniref:Putative secreted peptide n=1 Tax=Anopheles braziliensis TaxID=58242 RepID=A0A2M3ZWI3_9DIPT
MYLRTSPVSIARLTLMSSLLECNPRLSAISLFRTRQFGGCLVAQKLATSRARRAGDGGITRDSGDGSCLRSIGR